jgi:hypothetical protein
LKLQSWWFKHLTLLANFHVFQKWSQNENKNNLNTNKYRLKEYSSFKSFIIYWRIIKKCLLLNIWFFHSKQSGIINFLSRKKLFCFCFIASQSTLRLFNLQSEKFNEHWHSTFFQKLPNYCFIRYSFLSTSIFQLMFLNVWIILKVLSLEIWKGKILVGKNVWNEFFFKFHIRLIFSLLITYSLFEVISNP